MLIQCPNCDTKYNLDQSVLAPEGSKVRCIRCEHVFFVDSSGQEPDQEVAPKPEHDLDQELTPNLDWLDEMGGEKKGRSPSGIPEADQSGLDAETAQKSEIADKPKNKTMTFVLAGLVVTLLALGVLLYSQRFGESVSSWFGSSRPDDPGMSAVLGPEELHLISLQNVRQYFVTNEKIGQLFVIEGKARNDFPVPKELLRIEASLFDAQGQVVESKDFLAGNTVSLFQLQILSEQELEAALNARVGILTNNTNLRPGMEVQFMVVFPNPPEIIQEYGLKVIGAQHPPQ